MTENHKIYFKVTQIRDDGAYVANLYRWNTTEKYIRKEMFGGIKFAVVRRQNTEQSAEIIFLAKHGRTFKVGSSYYLDNSRSSMEFVKDARRDADYANTGKKETTVEPVIERWNDDSREYEKVDESEYDIDSLISILNAMKKLSRSST